MKAALSTRKAIVKLTVTDLRVFPIWEYASDEEGIPGQDETWVRLVNSLVVRKGMYSQIVATDFLTPTGRPLSGFMEVTTAKSKIEISRGAILGRVGYRCLPNISRRLAIARNYDWALRDRDSLLKALACTESDAFPLRYVVRVRIRGEKHNRKGTLN